MTDTAETVLRTVSAIDNQLSHVSYNDIFIQILKNISCVIEWIL